MIPELSVISDPSAAAAPVAKPGSETVCTGCGRTKPAALRSDVAKARSNRNPRYSYAQGERFSNDPRSEAIPSFLQSDPAVRHVFECAWDLRRAQENLSLAQSEFDAGELVPFEYEKYVAARDKALLKWLQADEIVRLARDAKEANYRINASR